MHKNFFAVLTILVIVLGVSVSLVSAKNPSTSSGPATGDLSNSSLRYDSVQAGQVIPEINGTYDVPGHPNLKVRVFVHNAKPAKPDKPGKPAPSPTPTPDLVCTGTDPGSEAVVSMTPWKLPASFTYKLNTGSVPASVGGSYLAIIASSSFNAWNSEIPVPVNLSGGNTGINRAKFDNNNIIAWGRASAGTLAVTYIWYIPSTGEVVELDTIMNQSYFWTWSNGSSTCAYTNSYDAQSILTHELGHWFGLNDHYTFEYENNTMFGYGYPGDAKGDTLTLGDIAGLQAIYPAP